MELEDDLKEFRALTLDVMEQVNIDGNIKFLLDRRENILKKIESLDFDRAEIRRVAKKLNIIELDKEMNKIIKIEMVNIKKKLNDLKKRQQGNQSYMYSFQSSYSGYSKFDKKF